MAAFRHLLFPLGEVSVRAQAVKKRNSLFPQPAGRRGLFPDDPFIGFPRR